MGAETGQPGAPPEPAVDPLSEIIRDLNERHGLQLGAGDEVVRRMTEALVDDAELQEAAAANSFANFNLLFEEKFEQRAIDARNQSWEFFEHAFGDEEVREQLEDALAREVYRRLSGPLPWLDRLDETSVTDEEREAVERFLRDLEESLGSDVEAVWLYGSRARNEPPAAESDVDLLVLTEGGRERDRSRVIDLASEAALSAAGQNGVSLSATVQGLDWVRERRAKDDGFIRRSIATRSCSMALRERPASRNGCLPPTTPTSWTSASCSTPSTSTGRANCSLSGSS